MASITIRIPEEMKAQLDKYSIKVSDVTRAALQKEIDEAREKRAEEAGERLGKFFAGMTREEIVQLIREGREEK